MKVLITGAGGQLGQELQGSAPEHIEVIALGHAGLDVSSAEAVAGVVNEALPEVIINTAAYTAVDRAEDDRDAAYQVNEMGARNIATAAGQSKARLIHLSTDFVFDGSAGRPYTLEDRPRPLGVYGSSKKAGEDAVREILGDSAVVLRTAWLYSRYGSNFVKTILELLTAKDDLAVVADEVGTPTWAKGLAAAIWQLAALDSVRGTHHWTDAGVASRYDFAVAIREEAIEQGLVGKAASIRPARAADHPRRARRPAYGVLDKTITWNALAIQPRHWREALREMLAEMKSHG